MNSIIEIKNVSFKYKGSNESLLDNVSLSINQGETLLLCGPSGSGKTTIIRLINGLIPHYYQGEISGEVEVLGRNIKETELYDLAGIVGTVFQNPRSQFFSVDTDGEIVFGPENIGLDPKVIKERSNHVVSEMKLEKLLGRSLFELSGGEKQKIACASVSALLPDIILLDEPSSNLDWGAIADLRECIERWKSQGKTIVISEHRLWYLAGLIDRVIYMGDGAIKSEWSGTEFESFDESAIKELKLRPTVLEERLIRNFSEANHSQFEGDSLGGYKLKDYYFAYKKKPYVFRKKSFSQSDGDLLDLNIPELVLPAQSIIGIIGENGAGKSTFLRCLCGLENDCTGVVIKEGKEYAGKKRLSLSYMVMQDVNHQLFTDSVKAEVLLSMKEEDEERCHEILDSLGILELKDKHPMALSGGQKQRVAIASALAAEADLILLDEPTSGLDYSHMVKVARLLQKLAEDGKTVLVSTHDPELIEICCTHVLRLEKGKGEILRWEQEINMYWDKVAKIYDLFEGILNRKVYEETGRRVAEEIDSGDIVLECACGTGAISKYIAPKCKSLVATDFSEKMLNQTKKKLKACGNVSAEFADITKLAYADETFHKVVAGNVIHLLDEPYRALEELMRVCKTGGKVIVPTYISMSQKKSGLLSKVLAKSGAGFKRQFDLASYKEFFERAEYKDVKYDVVQGTMPCAIAIIQKY